MKTRTAASGEFTGRHMLAIMLAFFGVIIGVNVLMAVVAGSSWTGFVVKNSYVASQEFNEKVAAARAQAALGWTSELAIKDGRMRFALFDSARKPVRITGGSAAFRRPAYEAEDVTVVLAGTAEGASGEAALHDGDWILEINADAGLDHPWHEILRIAVRGGELQ